jgi:hypothetical protein
MRNVWIVLAAVAALAAVACGSKSGVGPASVFPAAGEVQGWQPEGEPRVFNAENLWEYIDGDAEKYVHAGFDNTRNQAYKYQGAMEASADVYTMKTPQAAAAILAGESDRGSQPAATGDGGKLYRASLVFRKGRSLVRLVAYQEGPETQKALTDLGQAIAKRLEAAN